jgi:iron complex outermembrane recepter protein
MQIMGNGRHKKGAIPRALAAACGSMLASLAGDAMAQDETTEVRTTIRIDVTGSHIKRTDAEGPLPIQVITREEIDRAGWTTAAELMAHVAANFNGFNDQLSIGSAGLPGFVGANLRGIGEQYTLVLLNGRRLANYAFFAIAVDLSAIPFAAVDRVEILRDGASSIYGADAVAGVVNFILRKDFQGVITSSGVAVPQHPGADQYQATVTAGFGDLSRDRYNAFVNIDWQKEHSLAARDREFANTGYRPAMGLNALAGASFPGGIEIWHGDQFGGSAYPSAASGCAPPLSLPVPQGDRFTCKFDTPAIIDIVPPSERISVLARGTLQVAANHQLFAEYSYVRRDLDLRFSPTPVSRFGSPTLTPIRYPAGGPFYPTEFAAANGLAGDLDVNFRTLELGPRIDWIQSEAQRLLVGAEGRIGSWDYSTAYDHSVDEARDTLARGYLSTSRLASAMETGLINPFGPSGDEGRQLLAMAQIPLSSRSATGTLDQVDFKASTDWGHLPGGAVGFAVGAEARRERLDDHPHPSEEAGDVMSQDFFLAPQQASRRAEALFVEANLPLIPSVEAQLSTRYDHYNDFGGTTNPKIAVRWQPMRTLLLRGTWGTGFRTPTLVDLHDPQTATFTGPSNDPLRCPATGSEQDCGVNFRALQGGNPALKPERSTQYTLGAVWEPTSGSSASIHHWNIELRDAIASLGSDTIFDHIDVLGPGNVVRGPPDSANPTLPGPIRYVIVYQQNVGRLKTAGFDIDLRARTPVLSFGRVSVQFDGTYVTTNEQHLTGLPAESTLGQIGILGPVPRWRHYASLGFERGRWNATLAQTFQTGYTDGNPLPDDTLRRVGSYSLWDVQAGYTGVRNLTLTFGVKNLFDRNPPFTNSSFNGYDPAYADPRGRTFYARMSYAIQ